MALICLHLFIFTIKRVNVMSGQGRKHNNIRVSAKIIAVVSSHLKNNLMC